MSTGGVKAHLGVIGIDVAVVAGEQLTIGEGDLIDGRGKGGLAAVAS